MTDGSRACEQGQELPLRDTSSDVEILDVQYVSDPGIPRFGKLNRCKRPKRSRFPMSTRWMTCPWHPLVLRRVAAVERRRDVSGSSELPAVNSERMSEL